MAKRGMHIRWDWQTWVLNDYKHVSTICGVKTTAANGGIPGVSPEPDQWCSQCARVMHGTINALQKYIDAGRVVLSKQVEPLYFEAYLTTLPYEEAWKKRQQEIHENMRERRKARS